MNKSYTITRALVRLKALDSKIKNWNEPVIAVVKGKTKTVVTTKLRGSRAEDLNVSFKGSLQSVMDLIKERDAIKSKIIESNATTEILINSEKMTVAQAIERKASIQNKKDLLIVLHRNYTEELRVMNAAQSEYEDKINEALTLMLQKDTTKRAESSEIDTIKEAISTAHSPEFLDPNDIQKVIQSIRDEIQQFESEVDVALSESNARTVIQLD